MKTKQTLLWFALVLVITGAYVRAIDLSAKSFTATEAVSLSPLEETIPEVAGGLTVYYRTADGKFDRLFVAGRGDKIVESDDVTPNYTEWYNPWGQRYFVYTVPVGRQGDYVQIR